MSAEYARDKLRRALSDLSRRGKLALRLEFAASHLAAVVEEEDLPGLQDEVRAIKSGLAAVTSEIEKEKLVGQLRRLIARV